MEESHSIRTLMELAQRIDRLKIEEAALSTRITAAQAAAAASTDESDQEGLRLLLQMRETMETSLDSLRISYRSVQEAHAAQMAIAAPAAPTPASIRLVAPPAFAIGNDFEVFAAQLTNYVGGAAFPLQLQSLKSLLATDAFKACRSTLENTTRTDLKSVLAEIRPLLEPRRTLAARVNEFHNCAQRPDESLAKFAARIRSTGEMAYPEIANPEPYLIQQFVRGAHATSIQKNIVNSHACATLNEALNKIAEVVNVNDLNAEVFEVYSGSERRNNADGDVKRCSKCRRVGHLHYECYARSRLSNSNREQRPQNEERPRCQLCNGVGHVAMACRSVKFTPAKTPATAFRFKEDRTRNFREKKNYDRPPERNHQNRRRDNDEGNRPGVSKNAKGLSQN